MSNVLQPMKFARDCEVGDVIETGQGGPGDIIQKEDFDNGTVLLRWGVTETDSKIVSAYTGIVLLGRFLPDVYV